MPSHPAYILYFNAPIEWNTSDEHRGQWVIGVFDGFLSRGTIDGEIEILSVHPSYEAAASALVALMGVKETEIGLV